MAWTSFAQRPSNQSFSLGGVQEFPLLEVALYFTNRTILGTSEY